MNYPLEGEVSGKKKMIDNLKRTVSILSHEIGSRAYYEVPALNRAAEYITTEFTRYGYKVSSQVFEVRGNEYRNIFVEISGKTSPDKIIVIGAHYDTVAGTPGADDNASGIAGLLELARLLSKSSFHRTVHFVAFSLEEPPFFRTRNMGSYRYAKSLNEADKDVEGMICLEMIGYFTDLEESQHYPLPFFRLFYPKKGNFIALVSNIQSKAFLQRVKRSFRKGTDLPVDSLSALSIIPGVDFSDHRSFWRFGYDALMVTDTSFYRNPYYHGAGDLPETLDYGRMEKVVIGLKSAIEDIANQ